MLISHRDNEMQCRLEGDTCVGCKEVRGGLKEDYFFEKTSAHLTSGGWKIFDNTKSLVIGVSHTKDFSYIGLNLIPLQDWKKANIPFAAENKKAEAKATELATKIACRRAKKDREF